jgi:hypothetical protein
MGWEGVGLGWGWVVFAHCLVEEGGRTVKKCDQHTPCHIYFMCRILSSSSLTSQNGLLDFVHAPPKRNSLCPPHYEKKKTHVTPL